MSNETQNDGRKVKPVDFDMHGIVGVRLINPSDSDAAAVVNQLGPLQGSLNRDPDIVIQFKENISISHLKYLGLDWAGFTDDGFYVLRSSKAAAKVRIPFEKLGNTCEIICESGLRSIPLLLAIINLTFLKKGYIPLHASAFLYNGAGSIVTGWAKGGKSEALFSFANHGAQYVGDEWIILSGDGSRMYGIPEPIRVWDWQFGYISNLRPLISKEKKALFKAIHFLDAVYNTFGRGKLKRAFPLKVLNDALPGFKRQLNIQIPPEKLFVNGLRTSAAPDKIFLMMSHSEAGIHVEPCDPMEIAHRMISSIEFEQKPIFDYYKGFKFAFPDLGNDFLESIREYQLSLLCSALEGKEAYKVVHPYPVPFENLYHEMLPFLTPFISHPALRDEN
jgi:hypothetical protein